MSLHAAWFWGVLRAAEQMPVGCSHRQHPGAEAEGHWPGIVVGALHCCRGRRRPGAPPGACPAGPASCSWPSASMRQRRPLSRKQPVVKLQSSASQREHQHSIARIVSSIPSTAPGGPAGIMVNTVNLSLRCMCGDRRSGSYQGRCGAAAAAAGGRRVGAGSVGRAARFAAVFRRGRVPARARARRARHRAPARLPGAGLCVRTALESSTPVRGGS